MKPRRRIAISLIAARLCGHWKTDHRWHSRVWAEYQGKTWQDMRVDRFSPFTYGRDIKVSPQDPNTLYACLSVAASSKDGALYRSQDIGKTWQRFDKVTPHGTLMSVGLHHGDAKQVYVAARYGEVFGTQDGGESWLEMPLPQGVQHIYALACG
jgi:photosystem II stability/assembly factor-like uncharacterized protein